MPKYLAPALLERIEIPNFRVLGISEKEKTIELVTPIGRYLPTCENVSLVINSKYYVSAI